MYTVVHAEANAILHKTCIDLSGCTLYVTLFPCNECAKLIIQSGIKKVYFLEGEPKIPSILASTSYASVSSDASVTSDASEQQEVKKEKKEKRYTLASRRLFEMAGYTLLPFNSNEYGRTK